MPDARVDTAPPVAVLDQDEAATRSSADTSEFEALVEADLLVEDISIDGMCGVY